MPSVFTLEGADLGYLGHEAGHEAGHDPYPWPEPWPDQYPYSDTPAFEWIGPARPQPIVYDVAQLSDTTEFLRQRHPAVAVGLVFASSLLIGLAVGSSLLWLTHKAGYRPR